MNRTEHVQYLVQRAIDTTPAPVPQHVIDALPAIFERLLDETARWRLGEDADIGNLDMCQCTHCFAGAAGERLHEAGFGDEYGWATA